MRTWQAQGEDMTALGEDMTALGDDMMALGWHITKFGEVRVDYESNDFPV